MKPKHMNIRSFETQTEGQIKMLPAVIFLVFTYSDVNQVFFHTWCMLSPLYLLRQWLLLTHR